MNVSSVIKTTKSVITANSPVLLVGAAVAGVVATGILAAKGGYKARGIIDEAQAKRDLQQDSAPLTFAEKTQLTWLCYAAPAVTGATTIASVLGVHMIHTKRAAIAAGLYAAAISKLDTMGAEAEKLLSGKKLQEFNDNVAQKTVDEHPFDMEEVVINAENSEIFLDDWSGRPFTSSVVEIERAVNDLNRQLIADHYVTLNEYFQRIGLPTLNAGDDYGWFYGDKPGEIKEIEVKFGAALKDDQTPVMVARFLTAPRIDRRNT